MNYESIKKGKVVTFYSYKGGVGRTMALVNIASLLAKKNKRILLIDWDLEAPGLHNFFISNENKDDLGLIDFILLAKSIKSDIEKEYLNIKAFIENNIDDYISKNVISGSNTYNLDLIKAGKFDNEYTNKLNSINWVDFYKNSPFFFTIFAEVLETKYDYIFIDSRTGLSDTGGICTMLLPQILVTIFALNNQNINGVSDVAKQAIEYRFNSLDTRNFNVLPLPSRIDNENSEELKEWIDIYTNKFENLFKECFLLDDCTLVNYFNKAKIPYKSEYAYGEKIPVFNEPIDNDLFISYHYNEFCSLITQNQNVWEVLSESQIEDNKQKAKIHFIKGKELLQYERLEESLSEFEKVISLDNNDSLAYINCAEILSEIAKTKDSQEAQNINNDAIHLFQKAVEINPDHMNSYIEWKTNLKYEASETKLLKKQLEEAQIRIKELENTTDREKLLEGEANKYFINGLKYSIQKDYVSAIKEYEFATRLKPDYHEAFYNWGTVLGNLAKNKQGQEADELFHQALDKYQKAIYINPNDHKVFNNWGNALGNLAKNKEGQEADELFHQAFDKYQKAIDLKPDYNEAFYNWGTKIGNLAETKPGQEADELFYQAFDKFQKAIDIMPDDHDAFNNWGTNLGYLAENKEGQEADKLYRQAFDKYQKATDINPNYHEAFNNWGNDILKLAKSKEGQEAEELFLQALYKCQIALELGGHSYNLSCAYALKGNKDKALFYLDMSLSKKEINTEFVLNDEDWKDYLQDEDFLNLINKYR